LITRKPRWVVLISGRGSNLAALLEVREEIDIRLVVSSSAAALGLLRAKRAGVPTYVAPLVSGTKKLDWNRIDKLLVEHAVTHIFLAGFMKIVPAGFVKKWQERIVNLHPSLLPAYPGLESIQRAHADRAAIGLTVHKVNELVDDGEVICQRKTLNSELAEALDLESTEFFVHVDEQRVIKEAIRRWKELRIS
jgi:phosphoribosylglycinamide formyltransferase-1